MFSKVIIIMYHWIIVLFGLFTISWFILTCEDIFILISVDMTNFIWQNSQWKISWYSSCIVKRHFPKSKWITTLISAYHVFKLCIRINLILNKTIFIYKEEVTVKDSFYIPTLLFKTSTKLNCRKYIYHLTCKLSR